MEKKELEKRIKKILKKYERSIFLNKKTKKSDRSTIDESITRLENRETEARKAYLDDQKSFNKKMVAFSKEDFYLFEYLVYWKNINVKQLNEWKSIDENPLFGELLPEMIVRLEDIIEVGEEMIERCRTGKIPNVKLNKHAVNEVIGRISVDLYRVDDSIKRMKDQRTKQEENDLTKKERNNQKFAGEEISKAGNDMFLVDLKKKLETLKNRSVGKNDRVTKISDSEIDKKTMTNIKPTIHKSKNTLKKEANQMKQAFINYR